MTTSSTWPTHLLRVSDLTCVSLDELLALAARMKDDPEGWSDVLSGQSVACVLGGASADGRLAVEAAAHRLGMAPVALEPGELALGVREALADTARTLSTYASAVVVRNLAHELLTRLARASSVPVINADSPGHHPCQALADLLTLQERFGRLDGIALAYVGSAGNIARSLLEAGALASMDVRLACPAERGPEPEDRLWAEIVARRHGGSVTVIADPYDAVSGADAVYTAAWSDSDRSAVGVERLARYRVDARLMRAARPGAVFLHCLPAHRGEEVDAPVIDGRQSVVWEQAANRLPIEEAAIYALATGRRP